MTNSFSQIVFQISRNWPRGEIRALIFALGAPNHTIWSLIGRCWTNQGSARNTWWRISLCTTSSALCSHSEASDWILAHGRPIGRRNCRFQNCSLPNVPAEPGIQFERNLISISTLSILTNRTITTCSIFRCEKLRSASKLIIFFKFLRLMNSVFRIIQ